MPKPEMIQLVNTGRIKTPSLSYLTIDSQVLMHQMNQFFGTVAHYESKDSGRNKFSVGPVLGSVPHHFLNFWFTIE